MGKRSRDKGKRGEREARDAVIKFWYAATCVRSAQVSGIFAADLLRGPHGFHIEVKRYKRIPACDYMAQAADDADNHEVPVVLMREDHMRDWAVMLRIKDTEAFVKAILSERMAASKQGSPFEKAARQLLTVWDHGGWEE